MIIDKKYELLEKLSEGSFGQVYKGKNVRTDELVAVKIERKNGSVISSLKNEAKIYQYLAKETGFINLKWYNSNEKFTYLVTDLLVCSLTTLVKLRGSLDLKVVLQIGIQVIKRVQTLHGKYLLHRDVKPDNYMLDTNKQICLIDFGLCKRYDHNGVHIEEKQITSMVGSINFVSLNVHKGIEPSRRDDVESCIYIIIYLLLNGNLPWLLEKDMKKITYIKEQLTNSELMPIFIQNMLENVHQLKFNSEPDYGALISILETELLKI
jgi:serine/threonine protein kinase